MRSYYAHLSTAKSQQINKPHFRSSAIFPVLEQEQIHSRVLFLGYWILKRNIAQIAVVVTLRSDKGQILHRHQFTITEAKTFRIEVKEILQELNYPLDKPFEGTLEVEFFSTVNLVFPFPAVVINYYGPYFSSVVHTAQRVYNDFEDFKNNSQTEVAEAGFNIYADATHEPFIGLINGPEVVKKGTISLELFNLKNQRKLVEIPFEKMEPYQLTMLYPAALCDLKSFLEGNVGTGKIKFHFNWIFPRLVVGNIQHEPTSLSLTHTYYDCSNAVADTDYWISSQQGWHPASLFIPAYVGQEKFTNIFFYPIYSPTNFWIDLEIYDRSGVCLGKKEGALHIRSTDNAFHRVSLNEVCKELNINSQDLLAARLIARQEGNLRIPARIKIGLDIGEAIQPEMACNICNNLQPFNPALENKPSSFKWAPILADQPNSALWILNSSPAQSFTHTATLDLTFFKESSSETLQRKVTLPPYGFIAIDPRSDAELAQFLGGEIGWCSIITSNPYTTTYYFAMNPSGVIGGDHGF